MRIDRRFVGGPRGEPGLGAVGDGVLRQVTRGGKEARAAAKEKPLVVATRALPLGSVVAADAVRLRDGPGVMFPVGGFRGSRTWSTGR